MHFTTALVTLVSGLAFAAALPAEPRDLPPFDQVSLVDVVYGGSGCPAGTLSKAISDDKQLITLLFDQYEVESGPGIPPSKNRAACQLNLKMHFPQGWQ
jgi:Domain of unknown function (DUF4360)